MEEIICKKCGCVDDYTITDKGTQKSVICNACDKFIQFIPYDVIEFNFGIYKGREIAKCEDKGYLEWVLRNTKQKGKILKAIKERLNRL